jgi:hypothetical protein
LDGASGPAGSTVAATLAKAGLQVLVLERSKFPRFHIGESLLPASLPILERIGVNNEVAKTCLKKGGGKWMYGTIVGDAAFIVDPCYSLGVHMALYSGELAANMYLEKNEATLTSYEDKLRKHERNVTSSIVESFYCASRCRAVRKMVVSEYNIRFGEQQFVDFISGDFGRHALRVSALKYMKDSAQVNSTHLASRSASISKESALN